MYFSTPPKEGALSTGPNTNKKNADCHHNQHYQKKTRKQ